VQVLPVALEVEDRIPDELARAVKGDISPALDLKQVHASSSQEFRRGEKMRRLCPATKRDHGRMLNEQQDIIADLSGDHPSRDLALELEGGRIRHDTEVGNE
jgi:hypothetical protein